jgi:hypothetical protein
MTNAVIWTDSLSVLQALTSGCPELAIRDLRESLQDLSACCNIHLQWIPAHCGILGNEKADSFTKKGSSSHQPQVATTFKEIRTILKSNARDQFRQKHGHTHSHDFLRLLDRKPATIVYRLRTGHCRLHSHHLSRIGIAGTSLCEYPGRQPDSSTCSTELSHLFRPKTRHVARWCNTPPEALGEQGGSGNHCPLPNIHGITDVMRP